eukprot:15406218-Alexandrium_andersonii.AAC.1
MVGTSAGPCLETKGAEPWGISFFLVQAVDRRNARLGGRGPMLLDAGRILVRFHESSHAMGPDIGEVGT